MLTRGFVHSRQFETCAQNPRPGRCAVASAPVRGSFPTEFGGRGQGTTVSQHAFRVAEGLGSCFWDVRACHRTLIPSRTLQTCARRLFQQQFAGPDGEESAQDGESCARPWSLQIGMQRAPRAAQAIHEPGPHPRREPRPNDCHAHATAGCTTLRKRFSSRVLSRRRARNRRTFTMPGLTPRRPAISSVSDRCR